MLRPMFVAPESTIASTSARLSSSPSNIQAWSAPSSISPMGMASLWRGPAAKPSAETAMSV